MSIELSKYELKEDWSSALFEEVINVQDGLFKNGDWIESKDKIL